MLSLDITGVLAKTITPSLGIPEQEFATIRNTLKSYVLDFLKEREAGGHEWAQSPYDADAIAAVESFVATLEGKPVDTILWIGIGGSGLGPRVIREAFETARTPELIVLDTIDPDVLSEELKLIVWERALMVVASKSGGTLEPMSAFFLMENRMKAAIGEKAKGRVVAITDPGSGVLKEIADREGYAVLPIPSGIGGRYSIFTPIGLLPAALLGADIRAFVRGAMEMDAACRHGDLADNPAAKLAAVQFLLDTKRNYVIRVIMPYSTRLQSFGRWGQQLIAESLGKTEAYGPSPLAGVGTQDQHSLLQQWMQGRRNAWHLFIRLSEHTHLPLRAIDEPAFSFLSGQELGDVLDALSEGTAQSLTAAKRPHATITLPRLDAGHLGQLFFLSMAEVVLLSKLYRVNPYGQPAVELGKKIARDILSKGRV